MKTHIPTGYHVCPDYPKKIQVPKQIIFCRPWQILIWCLQLCDSDSRHLLGSILLRSQWGGWRSFQPESMSWFRATSRWRCGQRKLSGPSFQFEEGVSQKGPSVVAQSALSKSEFGTLSGPIRFRRWPLCQQSRKKKTTKVQPGLTAGYQVPGERKLRGRHPWKMEG